MRESKKAGWAVRRWQVLVGVRWQWFQCRVTGFYFRRFIMPIRLWQACGCPAQFRPQVPWWQPFVWFWLSITGWRQHES
jgi:hypothetical protein